MGVLHYCDGAWWIGSNTAWNATQCEGWAFRRASEFWTCGLWEEHMGVFMGNKGWVSGEEPPQFKCVGHEDVDSTCTPPPGIFGYYTWAICPLWSAPWDLVLILVHQFLIAGFLWTISFPSNKHMV